MRNYHFIILLLVAAFAGYINAAEKENLLTRPDLVFLADESIGLDFDSALQIKDEITDTSATITLSEGAPTELVYSFSGATVTPTSLKIFTSGLDRDQASVEILVSEDGPDVGYLSLRTEPLNVQDNWQRFNFEPAAAKWLMVKISAYAQASDFQLNEIEIEGYEGPPISLYAFNEAPSAAIDVLNGLEQIDLTLDIHPDEQALLKDAEDGKLDSWNFAEASLISSGVYDVSERAELLAQLDALTEEARVATANENSSFDKGRVLLKWLHDGSMNEGYVEAQTDMSEVLQKQHFNCVSSATLYNIIGRRLGLDARGIEVPDHAFTILYDGTDHVDVETTTAQGFDPARDRAAMNAFSRTTGYTYINDKHRAKRRELDDAGMIALTYYNHGVTATVEEDYASALLYYFRALSLDPDNKSAIKNTLSVLSNWSLQEIEKEEYGSAVSILNAALSFAPSDNSSRHNMRYALSKAMQEAGSADETSKLVAFAQELHTRTDDKTFLRLQSRAVQSKAYEFFDQGNYEEAVALTETLDATADDATIKDIERLRVSLFLNWSSEALDAGDHSQAMDVLTRAYGETPKDNRVKNNIAFTAQEWAASVTASEGTQQSQDLLLELAARFPDIKSLQRLSVQNYEIDAHEAYDAGNYERAIALYQTAQKLGGNKSALLQNEIVVWNTWGLSRLDQGDHQGALAIFEKALAAHPRDSKFQNNVAFIVQEWSKARMEQGGIVEAERTVAVQSERFSDVRQIEGLQGNFINNAVNSLKTAEDFAALAPTLENVSSLIKKSKLEQLVAVFYQNWGKTADEDFANEEALAILQSGITSYPENRHVKKLFLYSVDKLGIEAINAKDWDRAISIYQSATRILPKERQIAQRLEKLRQQI